MAILHLLNQKYIKHVLLVFYQESQSAKKMRKKRQSSKTKSTIEEAGLSLTNVDVPSRTALSRRPKEKLQSAQRTLYKQVSVNLC